MTNEQDRERLRAQLVAAGVDKPLIYLLDAAGLAIVPHEPSPSMLHVFYSSLAGMNQATDAGGGFAVRWKRLLKAMGFKVKATNWAERVVLSDSPYFARLIEAAQIDSVEALADEGRADIGDGKDPARLVRNVYFDIVDCRLVVERYFQTPMSEWPAWVREPFEQVRQRATLAMQEIGKRPSHAELAKLREAAARVMAYLEVWGPSIVGHLIDSDQNDGQRLRAMLPVGLYEATRDRMIKERAATEKTDEANGVAA